MDRSNRHGPNRLHSYLGVHETVIGRLLDKGTVEENTIEYDPGADGRSYLLGELVLRDPFGSDPYAYTVKLITDGDWPTLSEVIEEAEQWYWDHRDKL